LNSATRVHQWVKHDPLLLLLLLLLLTSSLTQ
jgi:hypothetical protein